TQIKLTRNLALQSAANNVVMHCAALHRHAGEIVTFYCEDLASDSTLAPSEGARTVEVPTVTLDETLAAEGPVRFMKIDIEGAESLALEGGREWLRSDRRPDYI